MSTTVDQLLSRTNLLWRPGQRRVPARTGLPTGFSALNEVLRESGWPKGALVELLTAQPGSGEMRLLSPALAGLSAGGLYQLWIDPPFDPFAPGLCLKGVDLSRLVIVRPSDHRQWLWATEQALRSPGCGAVICWSGASKSRYAELRKLQVAAAERSCVGFVFGHPRSANTASPAALRLQLCAAPTGLVVEVLKQRGGAAGQRVTLETPATLCKHLPLRQRQALVSASRFTLGQSRARGLLVHPELPVMRELWQ
jgi:hypothetical protein